MITIPRTIHIVWVGDESRRPDNCIDTWRQKNPDWQVRVWGNADLAREHWKNARHIQAMRTREWNGVADMMRWEILLAQGGFAVDADSVCMRALEDWLFANALGCACFENEQAASGLLAAGYVAAVPGNAILHRVVEDIYASPSVTQASAWITVGPKRLTDAYRRSRRHHPEFRIWPSHYFIPEHHSGVKYTGSGPIFAEQKWASTKGLYPTLYRAKI